jgi:hypothetical protein
VSDDLQSHQAIWVDCPETHS